MSESSETLSEDTCDLYLKVEAGETYFGRKYGCSVDKSRPCREISGKVLDRFSLLRVW